MNDLSKAERFKKCLNCGSEEHRAADCKATRRKDLAQQEPKSKPQVAQVSQPASSALPIVQATPLMSMDSFPQQATQALRQIEASQAGRCSASSHCTGRNPNHTQTGRWWPASAITITTTAIHQTFGHHFYRASKVLSGLSFGVPKFGGPKPPSRAETGGLGGPDLEVPLAYALLDAGATRPMRQARDEREWDAACEVQVALAGDNTTSMRLTASGTLLLPPGRDGLVQPIVPMGAIIEQLGYKFVWSAGSCKLYPPDLLNPVKGQKRLPRGG